MQASDITHAGLSRSSSQQQVWAAGGRGAAQHSSPQASAEEGTQLGGGLSSCEKKAGLDQAWASAQTYAERMHADAGPLLSRGHLAAALCKARQDVSPPVEGARSGIPEAELVQ